MTMSPRVPAVDLDGSHGPEYWVVVGRGRGFGRGLDAAVSDMAISELNKLGLCEKSGSHTKVTCFFLMTSPPPLIFKRTKSKPAHRQRDTSPDDNKLSHKERQYSNSADAEESPSTLVVKLKNKVKKNKANSKLSFGGDEEVSAQRLLYNYISYFDKRKRIQRFFKSRNQV